MSHVTLPKFSVWQITMNVTCDFAKIFGLANHVTCDFAKIFGLANGYSLLQDLVEVKPALPILSVAILIFTVNTQKKKRSTLHLYGKKRRVKSIWKMARIAPFYISQVIKSVEDHFQDIH